MTFARLLRHLAVFHLVLLMLTAALSAGESDSPSTNRTVRLRYQFQPGQFLHYEVEHDMTIDLRFEQGQMITSNSSKTRKHFRVVSVDSDGQALLEAVIDRVRMSARADDGDPIAFDSRDGEDKCPAEYRRVMDTIGKPLSRATFTRSGHMVQMTPMLGSNDGIQPAGATDELSPAQNYLIEFPDRELSIGETWKDRFEVPVVIPSSKLQRRISLQRTYRLESVEGDVATISLKTSVLTPLHDPQIRAQLIQRTPSGTIQFDCHRGVLVSRTIETDKTEIDGIGPKTSMHATSKRIERLIEPTENTDSA